MKKYLMVGGVFSGILLMLAIAIFYERSQNRKLTLECDRLITANVTLENALKNNNDVLELLSKSHKLTLDALSDIRTNENEIQRISEYSQKIIKQLEKANEQIATYLKTPIHPDVADQLRKIDTVYRNDQTSSD